MKLGLELGDGVAVAVVVDEDGTVRARSEVKGADLASTAVEAADRVAASRGDAHELGVSSIAPDGPATAAALESLARKYAGAFVRDGAISSGTAAAVAEAWTGAAQQARQLVFFSVADHATAGIVREGVALVGAHGRGPAVAWLALNPVEREDYRKTGCLEAEVAASGIVRRLIWRIKAGDHSRVQDMVNGDLTTITVDHLLDAARQNDGVSISVVRETAKYLGMAAANLVAVADPDTLVVGGIMASAADLFLEPLRQEIGRRLPGPIMQALTIAPAALGSDAAAIGAARAAATAPR